MGKLARKAINHAHRESRPRQTLPLSPEELSELVGMIYEGPLEQVPWKSALDLIRRYLRANYVTLILRPPAPGQPALMVNAAGDRPVEREALYSNYYEFDPFVGLPPDRVFTGEEFVSNHKWRENNPFYLEILKPLDIHHGMGADIRTDDGVECRFRVSRSRREPPFSADDKALCTSLLPHLKRAVRLHSHLDLVDSERKLYAGTVDRMSVGTVILDESGAIINTNRAAEQIFDEHDGIQRIKTALQADYGAENRELQRIIRQALVAHSGSNAAVIEAMSITRPSGRARLGVLIRTIPLSDWSEGKRRPSVVVFIRDPARRSEASNEMLRRLFDLTPAEASLALLLANGLTLDEAARELNIRKNTARAHLRSIFSKVGVTRQTTLVRVLLSSVVWLG